MRILVLTSMFPPHHFGGYELLCEDVVARWRRAGHECVVLTTTMRLAGVDDPPDERALVRRDLDFYYRGSRVVSPTLPGRLRVERQNQRALDVALDDVRPDVVSVWHMGAMSMGLLTTLARRGVPMVMVIGDLWPLYGPVTDAWFRVFADRPRIGRQAELVTRVPCTVDATAGGAAWCFASAWLRRLVETESRFEPVRAAVVHHGVDLDVFRPVGPAPPRPWRWRLACIGRLDDRKGVHFAVRALPLLPPEATLTVSGRGDDSYLGRLRAEARALGAAERVVFGESSREQLRGRYAEADVVIFPPTWEEPFGLVPLEAMACGTPVVATATGGSAEFLVHGANCLVVPKSDERAIADAVSRLAADDALRARLIAGGLVTAGLFGVGRLAASLAEWHAAAAVRFRDGTPEEAPPARSELEQRGLA